MLIVSTLGCGKTTACQNNNNLIDLDVFIKKECYHQTKYFSLLKELIRFADDKGLTILMNMQWYLKLCQDDNYNVEFYFPKNPRSKIIYDREINKIGKERTEKLIKDYEQTFDEYKIKAKQLSKDNGWRFIELEENEYLGGFI